MNPQNFQQLMQQLDKLGQKLGMVGAQIWTYYLREMRIEGIEYLVGSILTFLAAIGFSVMFGYGLEEDYDVVWGWGFVFMLGCLIATIVLVCNWVPLLYNPGYCALQRILGR